MNVLYVQSGGMVARNLKNCRIFTMINVYVHTVHNMTLKIRLLRFFADIRCPCSYIVNPYYIRTYI